MNDRLRTAYVTALEAGHSGSRAEMHMGTAFIEELRRLAGIPGPVSIKTIWGIPVIEVLDDPEHLSVHSVTIIHP